MNGALSSQQAPVESSRPRKRTLDPEPDSDPSCRIQEGTPSKRSRTPAKDLSGQDATEQAFSLEVGLSSPRAEGGSQTDTFGPDPPAEQPTSLFSHRKAGSRLNTPSARKSLLLSLHSSASKPVEPAQSPCQTPGSKPPLATTPSSTVPRPRARLASLRAKAVADLARGLRASPNSQGTGPAAPSSGSSQRAPEQLSQDSAAPAPTSTEPPLPHTTPAAAARDAAVALPATSPADTPAALKACSPGMTQTLVDLLQKQCACETAPLPSPDVAGLRGLSLLSSPPRSTEVPCQVDTESEWDGAADVAEPAALTDSSEQLPPAPAVAVPHVVPAGAYAPACLDARDAIRALLDAGEATSPVRAAATDAGVAATVVMPATAVPPALEPEADKAPAPDTHTADAAGVSPPRSVSKQRAARTGAPQPQPVPTDGSFLSMLRSTTLTLCGASPIRKQPGASPLATRTHERAKPCTAASAQAEQATHGQGVPDEGPRVDSGVEGKQRGCDGEPGLSAAAGTPGKAAGLDAAAGMPPVLGGPGQAAGNGAPGDVCTLLLAALCSPCTSPPSSCWSTPVTSPRASLPDTPQSDARSSKSASPGGQANKDESATTAAEGAAAVVGSGSTAAAGTAVAAAAAAEQQPAAPAAQLDALEAQEVSPDVAGPAQAQGGPGAAKQAWSAPVQRAAAAAPSQRVHNTPQYSTPTNSRPLRVFGRPMMLADSPTQHQATQRGTPHPLAEVPWPRPAGHSTAAGTTAQAAAFPAHHLNHDAMALWDDDIGPDHAPSAAGPMAGGGGSASDGLLPCWDTIGESSLLTWATAVEPQAGSLALSLQVSPPPLPTPGDAATAAAAGMPAAALGGTAAAKGNDSGVDGGNGSGAEKSDQQVCFPVTSSVMSEPPATMDVDLRSPVSASPATDTHNTGGARLVDSWLRRCGSAPVSGSAGDRDVDMQPVPAPRDAAQAQSTSVGKATGHAVQDEGAEDHTPPITHATLPSRTSHGTPYPHMQLCSPTDPATDTNNQQTHETATLAAGTTVTTQSNTDKTPATQYTTTEGSTGKGVQRDEAQAGMDMSTEQNKGGSDMSGGMSAERAKGVGPNGAGQVRSTQLAMQSAAALFAPAAGFPRPPATGRYTARKQQIQCRRSLLLGAYSTVAGTDAALPATDAAASAVLPPTAPNTSPPIAAATGGATTLTQRSPSVSKDAPSPSPIPRLSGVKGQGNSRAQRAAFLQSLASHGAAPMDTATADSDSDTEAAGSGAGKSGSAGGGFVTAQATVAPVAVGGSEGIARASPMVQRSPVPRAPIQRSSPSVAKMSPPQALLLPRSTGTRVQLPSPPLFEARSRPMTEARVTSPAGPTARARLLLHGSPMHSGSTSSGIGAATTAGTTDVPTTASGMPRAGAPPPPPLPAPQPPRAPAPSRALAPSLGGMTLDDLLGGVGDEGSVLHVHRNTHSQRAPKGGWLAGAVNVPRPQPCGLEQSARDSYHNHRLAEAWFQRQERWARMDMSGQDVGNTTLAVHKGRAIQAMCHYEDKYGMELARALKDRLALEWAQISQCRKEACQRALVAAAAGDGKAEADLPRAQSASVSPAVQTDSDMFHMLCGKPDSVAGMVNERGGPFAKEAAKEGGGVGNADSAAAADATGDAECQVRPHAAWRSASATDNATPNSKLCGGVAAGSGSSEGAGRARRTLSAPQLPPVSILRLGSAGAATPKSVAFAEKLESGPRAAYR